MSFVDASETGLDRVAALAGAVERISEPEVIGYDDPAGADFAEVAVRFVLAGETWEVRLSVRESGTGWRVEETGLAGLELSTDLGGSVDVGGVTASAGAVTLLPAVYRLRAAPVELFTGEAEVIALPAEVTGASPPPSQVVVAGALSPGAAALAQEQIDAYAEECTQPAATVADGCGLLIPWTADLRTLDAIAYRVERLPAVSISADGRSFDAAGGVLVATVSGTAHDGSAASVTYRDDDWALRGIVRVDADGLTLGVR